MIVECLVQPCTEDSKNLMLQRWTHAITDWKSTTDVTDLYNSFKSTSVENDVLVFLLFLTILPYMVNMCRL